jgi:hypothetical protein
MFGDVFTEDERAELLDWIQAWEDAHPDAPPAERVTAWIDVAYAFQSRGASRPSWSPSRTARNARARTTPDTALSGRLSTDHLSVVAPV